MENMFIDYSVEEYHKKSNISQRHEAIGKIYTKLNSH